MEPVDWPSPFRLLLLASLDEFFVCNPGKYSKEYFEALSNTDCQTYLSAILYEANLIWFKHSNKFGLKSAAYISKKLDNINLSEIIKYSELVDNNLKLNDDGNLTFRQILDLCIDEDKKNIVLKSEMIYIFTNPNFLKIKLEKLMHLILNIALVELLMKI